MCTVDGSMPEGAIPGNCAPCEETDPMGQYISCCPGIQQPIGAMTTVMPGINTCGGIAHDGPIDDSWRKAGACWGPAGAWAAHPFTLRAIGDGAPE
mmetsp:Transcript_40944/g.116134  ORF Transcript_40944/g.116134 Transcript_40944/m.116134 type:complete len:96 (+) Transcript_40944:480-767(+)